MKSLQPVKLEENLKETVTFGNEEGEIYLRVLVSLILRAERFGYRVTFNSLALGFRCLFLVRRMLNTVAIEEEC